MRQDAPPAAAPARPTTSPTRFLAALLIGAGLGGAVISGLVLYDFAQGGRLDEGLSYARGVFFLGTGFWLAGLLLVGGPAVWALYAAGIGSRATAALAGAVLAFSAMLLLSKLMSPHMSLTTFIEQSSQVGASGAVVGWVVAWVAYGSGSRSRR